MHQRLQDAFETGGRIKGWRAPQRLEHASEAGVHQRQEGALESGGVSEPEGASEAGWCPSNVEGRLRG